MRTSTLLLTIIVLLATACKKSTTDPHLPTSTGSNTVYYIINDKEHLVQGKPGAFSDQGVSVTATTHGFTFISSYNRDGYIYDDLSFYIPTIAPELNKPYMIHYVQGYDDQSDYHVTNGRYYPDTAVSKVVFTHYDADVVAGTFFFRSLPDSTGQTITLYHGWFDISRDH